METVPKKLYQFENKTFNLLLNKSGLSSLPERIKQVEKDLDSFAGKVSNDLTKTPAAQTMMLCEKIESAVMSILKDLDRERATAFLEVQRAEQRFKSEIKFKDTTDLLICARYGDSITDKGEFLNLVSSDFDAARIALQDPLTRKKFRVEDDSVIAHRARRTAELKIFGEEGVEKNKQLRQRIEVMHSYGEHFTDIITTVDSIRKPIAANMV